MSLAPSLTEIEYPETDGKPMGETDLHRAWMIRIYDLLKFRYRGQRVYIGSDLLLYYVEGVPRKFVVPDNFVVLDCDPGLRRVFKTWTEGRVPNVVFEVTSRYTRREDELFKPRYYAEIGVKELFLYDPTGDYLDPPLQGFRLHESGLVRLEENPAGVLECRELGLLFRLDANRLVVEDQTTGRPLLTEAEAEQAAREAAEARAKAAEQEIERLRDELRHHRRDQP